MSAIVSPELRARVRGMAIPIALAFGRLGLTPNALTVIGFGIAVVAAVGASQGAWALAAFLVIFGGVFDLFDGALARATNRVSRVGAFLDSVFDRAGESILFIGIGVGSLAAGVTVGAVLAASAMAASFMVSYTRAKSESLGFTPGTGMANVGLAPREVRLVIVTIGLLATAATGGAAAVDCGNLFCVNDAWAYGRLPLAATLALITVLATVTTLQRILHVVRQPQSSSEEHA
jgi:phosphatidylglycerophosphate synthase